MKRSPIRKKSKPAKSAKMRFHHDRVAELGCLISGGPATLHHVSSDGFKNIGRSDELVVPLAPKYHLIQHGPRDSVEALGHAGFTARYGIDLLAEAKRLWAETEAAWEHLHGRASHDR